MNLNSHDMVHFANSLQNLFKKNLKSIVLIQAWIRGSITRRRVAESLKAMNGHQAYMSGDKSNFIFHFSGDYYEPAVTTDSGQQLEERGEVVFKNGAVYKG